MGTSKESISKDEQEEGEVIIPWAFVPYSVRRELIKKLNPDVTMSGNDWRMLASELGYTTADISYIESEKDNNTTVLFKQYDTKPGASLNDVYRSLEKMQRRDCMDIIRKALPDIHQAFSKASESQMLHTAETTEMLSSRGHHQWPGSPCPCTFTHHPTSAYGGHAYPCSHGFVSCGGTCHSPQLGTCPSPYHVHLPHPHPTMCQTFSQSETVKKTCEPSFSSCLTNPPYYGYLMKPKPGCHGSIAQPSGSSSPGHQRSSPTTRRTTQGNQESTQLGHSGFSPGPSSYRNSPTFQNDQEDSVMAEPDPQSQKYSHITSLKHHASSVNTGMMVPIALPETFLRSQVNNVSLPNNISAMDNSNLLSSDSSNSDSFSSRQKVARQYSDECNVTQASNGDKRFRNNSSNNNNSREALGSRDSIDQQYAALPGAAGRTANIGFRPKNSSGQSPKFIHPSDAAGFVDCRDRYYQQDCEVKVRNGPGGCVPKCSPDVSNQVACGEAKTSLALLEKLATVPDKFKPTNEYKTFVAEQKIQVDKYNRDEKGSGTSSHNSNGFGRNPPSTFPMRVKVKHDRGMEDLKNLTISKKSTSMPQNMKPVEYRKAFRHIKVFVTYSYDNENHGKQVLSLCKFLQSNGFACCVDVGEKKTSAKSLEQLEWCRKKVLEADFVLVCISQKYLEDISSASSPFSSQASERQLHTREIYELMNSEYLNSQHNGDGESNSVTAPQRFVPLLFPNMAHHQVPSWMMNGPAYVWPLQYKDLAWMLTKPQERIKGRRDEQLEERERRGSDLDVASSMDRTHFMNSVMCSS